MRLRRLSWTLLLWDSALTLSAILASVWVVRSAPPRELPWSAVAGVALIALAALLGRSANLARVWSHPLRRITETARSLSTGDFRARADAAQSEELAGLARSLNEVRDQLVGQVDTIDKQRRTLVALLAQIQEGVLVADGGGRIALVNPAAVRLLNLRTSGDAEPHPLTGIAVERCIPQHDLQQMLLARDPAAPPAGDEPGAPQQREARLTVETPHGVLHILARASDILLPEAEPGNDRSARGRLLVLTDITELARTLQIKTDFVTNASHELRTPLSTIRAAVEALAGLDLAREAATAQPFIERIDRHSARLVAMVSDLLDLARLESGASRFDPQPLRLAGVFEDLRERFAAPAAARGVSLVADVSAYPDAMVVVHPHLLRLTLDNLTDNAIKFSERGGSVRISCTRADDTVTIEVADAGCGIPDEDVERVFERFYQVQRARSGAERGTGLGLSIVRHSVAAMGGTIRLASALGKGTRITVALPAVIGAAGMIKNSSETP